MGLPKTYGLEIRKLAPQEVPDPDLPKCPDLNCLYGGRQPECTQKGSGSAQCPDLKVPDLRKTTVYPVTCSHSGHFEAKSAREKSESLPVGIHAVVVGDLDMLILSCHSAARLKYLI